MKLYEEIDLIENAINKILYGEEEIDLEALDNLMQAKTETIANGLETLCKIRARKQGEINAIKDEITRLKEKADRETKALDRLESYMQSMFLRSGEKKITAGTFTLSTRTSTSVLLEPEFNVPEYMRTKTVVEPDKTAIKEALKEGKQIAGASLATKENLQIR